MALNTIFRRASSTAVALAFRTVRSRTTFGAVATTERMILGSQLCRGTASSFSRFSTGTAASSDENLIRVLDSEIECAETEENPDRNVLEDKPEGFPFEIVDNSGERTVLLKRKFEDETIQVEVDKLTAFDDENEEEEGDNNEDEEGEDRIRVPMVVSVAKGDGFCLEFGVSAYPDEIVIDSLSIKRPDSDDQLAYEGPDFEDLDENLQKAFLKFLEVRGIKASTTNFLIEYMANKDSREYLQWLKDLKSFIQK